MALFLVTRHTYGSPPRYLLEDGAVVPDEVAAHWRRWIADEWPRRKTLSPVEATRAELTGIRALLATGDEIDFETARERAAALFGRRYADYAAALERTREWLVRRLAAGAEEFAAFGFRARYWATE
jgi:hypothetical protein